MSTPPPAEGVRQQWQAIPEKLRKDFEQWLGSPIVRVQSQATGFSPGVAARLRTADGQRIFVKAIGPEPNPGAVVFHRREKQITERLPVGAPVPRLRWSADDEADTGWVMLAFEDIDGRLPAQPWQPSELELVMAALADLARLLTPSPLTDLSRASDTFEHRLSGWRRLLTESTAGLDDWSRRHLAKLAAIEATTSAAVDGDTLLHFDLRADNMLLTENRVWFVDWPHACIGAAWVDVLLFAPSVHMQGGPTPEELIARSPVCLAADPDALTAAVIAIAGFFIRGSLQPPPPGLPTLRAFQAAQGAVALAWIQERTGWR